MEAVTCVELTKVVVRADPAKFTTELLTKFVPLTVSVNAASPTFTLEGEMLVVVGAGLLTVSVPGVAAVLVLKFGLVAAGL